MILAMFNRKTAWLIEHDLPKDARAIVSWSSPGDRGINIVIESEEFDLVPEGQEYPRGTLPLKMRGVPVDVLQQAATGFSRRAKDWAFLCDTPIRGIEPAARITFREFLKHVVRCPL